MLPGDAGLNNRENGMNPRILPKLVLLTKRIWSVMLCGRISSRGNGKMAMQGHHHRYNKDKFVME
jgi:hypothetical protein